MSGEACLIVVHPPRGGDDLGVPRLAAAHARLSGLPSRSDASLRVQVSA